jgi:hypothetical protein
MHENIFTNLPPDLLDLIFVECAINSNNNGSKHYIKYKLNNNDLHKYRYVGDMGAEGVPHGRGELSTYILHDISLNTDIPINTTNANSESIWLYIPFLAMIGDYDPQML